MSLLQNDGHRIQARTISIPWPWEFVSWTKVTYDWKMTGLFHLYGRFLEPFPATCSPFPVPLCSRVVFELYELLLIVQKCLYFFLFTFLLFMFISNLARDGIWCFNTEEPETLSKRKLQRRCNNLNLSKSMPYLSYILI